MNTNKAAGSSRTKTGTQLAALCLALMHESFSPTPASATRAGREYAGPETLDMSTAGYADATFEVLHQALRVVQLGESGARLDALAEALKHLSHCCHAAVSKLLLIDADSGVQSAASAWLGLEVQRAKTIACAVQAVLDFVQRRALDDLDRQDLNEAWLKLWRSLALPAGQAG